MHRADRWAGGIFLLLGILAVAETRKLDYGGAYGAGPGFFPFWLGTTIALLGAILLGSALWRSVDGAGLPTQPTPWKKKTLGYCGLLFFVLAIEFVGFVTAFTLLVAFLLRAIEGESWRGAIVTALGSGLGLYLFFVRLLDVKLPSGPLGF
jgi:putative tricarboxylic transport membrane protein